jgi:hypothetical protein
MIVIIVCARVTSSCVIRVTWATRTTWIVIIIITIIIIVIIR